MHDVASMYAHEIPVGELLYLERGRGRGDKWLGGAHTKPGRRGGSTTLGLIRSAGPLVTSLRLMTCLCRSSSSRVEPGPGKKSDVPAELNAADSLRPADTSLLEQGVKISNKALLAEVDSARLSQEALRVREAGLLEAERAAAADADALRASLATASVAAEAAVAAAASAEAKAAAHAAKAGREAATASQRENQVATAAAAEARELEVRKLEETVARLQKHAEEELSEVKRELAVRTEEAAAAEEERDAWAVRSGAWEREAERLAGEVEVLSGKAAGLKIEVEAAVATASDLEARLRKAEDGAAKAKGREAELSDQLGVAQVGCLVAVTLLAFLSFGFVSGRVGKRASCGNVRLCSWSCLSASKTE